MPLRRRSDGEPDYWYPDNGLRVISVPEDIVDDSASDPLWIGTYTDYIDFRNWRYLRKREEKI